MFKNTTLLWLVGFAVCSVCPTGAAQEKEKSDSKKDVKADPLQKINDSLGKLRKLPEGEVWIETKKKLVVVDGKICLRIGPLEMFACPPETKEHESVVQANSTAKIVHTALLMIGAESGKPVVWDPKYAAAHGDTIDIEVHWLDKDGKHKKLAAQEMIKNIKTKKAMKHKWVFAGSEFYTNPNTKKTHYMADGGEMICVSNFTTAMMDLPIESTQSREGLLFEAFTERIPPMKTPVRLVLKLAKKKKKTEASEKGQPESKKGDDESKKPQPKVKQLKIG